MLCVLGEVCLWTVTCTAVHCMASALHSGGRNNQISNGTCIKREVAVVRISEAYARKGGAGGLSHPHWRCQINASTTWANFIETLVLFSGN